MKNRRLEILLISTLVFPSTLLVANFPATAQTLRYDTIETQKQRIVCVNERSAQLAPSELSPFHPAAVPQSFTFYLRSPAGRYAYADVYLDTASSLGSGSIQSVKVYGNQAMCYSQDAAKCESKVWSNARDKVAQSNCSSSVLCVYMDRKTNIVTGKSGSSQSVCGSQSVQDQNLPLKLQRMGCRAPINIKEGMTAQQVQAKDSQYYWCFK
ncbi:hypothetical protein [Pseudanabaena mucicola]|uniref:hypothetical protein n=1 Tax=Pseudanabaena mucicola TaxID=71190 RepID=UPI0025758B62|nr:hypothetical protein [Pseudanabaena mucicola]